MADEDLKLALELQRQFDEEYAQTLQNNKTSHGKSSATAVSNVIKTEILDDLELALRLDRELNEGKTSSAAVCSSNPYHDSLGLVDPKAEPRFKTEILEDDFELARRLDRELNEGHTSTTLSSSKLCNDSLELQDPNPDPIAMFVEFDKKYFWGQLASVEVLWSKKMTLCAGLCEYHGQKSGVCRIKLSEPLLKFRPRKDLLETLLHEMIHAYLFLTKNDRDRDGHGPEFQKHMRRLNQSTGLNITIYHSFHNEVANYQQHWWQCTGPCKDRHPYYGLVKRAMNRAPSSSDRWWADHQQTCGGTFYKVKEPEAAGKKRKLEESPGAGSKNKLKKIDSYFSPIDKGDSLSQLPKLPSDVRALSDLLDSSSNGFGLKNDFMPSNKDNRGTHSKCEEEKSLLNRKRKSDSPIDLRKSSSAKVLKFEDANEYVSVLPESKHSKTFNWPKSFASKLVISTLSQGEQQLRRNDLKVGETIDIPNFVSVTNPNHKQFHNKKNDGGK